MKKIFKEYTVIPAGGTITLKANDIANYYMITGNAATLTAGFTIDIDAASKNNAIRIYWNQAVTIGAGGAITILGNSVTEYDVLDDVIIDCSYDGTKWINVITQNLSVSTLSKPLWNHTVTVNYDLLNNDSSRNMFKSYAEAITYINTQTPLTTDHWTVYLTSGLCNEDMILYPNIDIQGVAGTVIKSVTSSIASIGTNTMDGIVRGCTINTVKVAQGKTMHLIGCVVVNQAPVPAATDGYVEMDNCMVMGGDLSNTISVNPWYGCNIDGTVSDLNVNLTHCRIKVLNLISCSETVEWNNCNVEISSLVLNNGAIFRNSFLYLPALAVEGGSTQIYLCQIFSQVNVNNAAILGLHNTESTGGFILFVNDTATLGLYGANRIDSAITKDAGATIVDYSAYYDNAISGLTNKTIKLAIDELAGKVLPLRLAFASLDAPDDTTITANGTYYPIEGTFTNSPLESFAAATAFVPGIKYTDAKTMYFEIDWHGTVEADIASTTVSVGVKKNNVLIPASVMSSFLKTGGEAGNISGTIIVSLEQDDEIQLAVTSDGDGDVITFNNFTTSIISIIN